MDEILRAMNAENERLLQESRSGDWDTVTKALKVYIPKSNLFVMLIK